MNRKQKAVAMVEEGTTLLEQEATRSGALVVLCERQKRLAQVDEVFTGQTLRAQRESQGLYQEEVATAAGISTSHLSRIENNLTTPDIETAIKLCFVLSLDLGAISRL